MITYSTRIKYQTYSRERATQTYLKSIVASAYVLYPGDRVTSEDDEKIGGLPLRPDLPSSLLNAVQKQLQMLFIKADLLT
jgi:hypothetical protein